LARFIRKWMRCGGSLPLVRVFHPRRAAHSFLTWKRRHDAGALELERRRRIFRSVNRSNLEEFAMLCLSASRANQMISV